jgi:beta-barrel assembly-enhancing protease
MLAPHPHSTSRQARAAALALLVVSMSFSLAACGSAGVRQGGFNLVSVEEEWAMRDELHAQVRREMRVSPSDYLNTVGRRIAGQTALGNRQWDFYLVQNDQVNAFNLPGGLVYVNAGLVREADTLDELASVMAHEIGHGASRHGTQLMTRAYGYNAIAGLLLGRNAGQTQQILAQLVGTGILTNYSRDAENEADRLGVAYMYQAGYDPRGASSFMKELLTLRRSRPNAVAQFFSSHPLTEDRIRNIDGAIAKLPRKASLTHDTPTYQRFRSQVRG